MNAVKFYYSGPFWLALIAQIAIGALAVLGKVDGTSALAGLLGLAGGTALGAGRGGAR
jgi:hypothetical protein